MSYLPPVICKKTSYLRCLCLFTYIGVHHVLCCVVFCIFTTYIKNMKKKKKEKGLTNLSEQILIRKSEKEAKLIHKHFPAHSRCLAQTLKRVTGLN